MPTPYAPLVAPALWQLAATDDFNLIDISEPIPGWQQATIKRIHPEVGPGSSILIVTVMPNGVTQVLDPYMTTVGFYTNFVAALRYLINGQQQVDNYGLTIDFPTSP